MIWKLNPYSSWTSPNEKQTHGQTKNTLTTTRPHAESKKAHHCVQSKGFGSILKSFNDFSNVNFPHNRVEKLIWKWLNNGGDLFFLSKKADFFSLTCTCKCGYACQRRVRLIAVPSGLRFKILGGREMWLNCVSTTHTHTTNSITNQPTLPPTHTVAFFVVIRLQNSQSCSVGLTSAGKQTTDKRKPCCRKQTKPYKNRKKIFLESLSWYNKKGWQTCWLLCVCVGGSVWPKVCQCSKGQPGKQAHDYNTKVNLLLVVFAKGDHQQPVLAVTT